MQFALILLLVLAAACAFGSFITQGQTLSWYTTSYGERAAAAIMLFGLDDVFHSIWFVVITAFLCLNLIFCNVIRAPGLIRLWKAGFVPEKREKSCGRIYGTSEKDPAELFSEMGFRKTVSGSFEDGTEYIYAVKNKAGIWGAWLCHLGILILIIGFGVGQMLKTETAVYGVTGQSKRIGDTSYVLTIDDFRIDLRGDETVDQYTTDFTVRNVSNGDEMSGTTSVNHPAAMFGMKFYQNSTGWAAAMHVSKGGEEIQNGVVCVGEVTPITEVPGLSILIQAFYPDFFMDADGEIGTRTSELRNPYYLYIAYYNERVIGMNALGASEYITIDDLTVWFTDPQSYTLIQITTEPFSKLALAGGIVIMLGLLLALYVQPAEMWARKKDGLWLVTGLSRKGGVLFDRALREKLEKAGIRVVEKDDKKPPKESSEDEKPGESGEKAEEDEKHGKSGEKSEEDGKSGEESEEDEKSGEPEERAEPDEKAEVSGELSGKDLSEAEAAALEAMKLADEAAEAYRAAEERAKKAALAYKEARERAGDPSHDAASRK